MIKKNTAPLFQNNIQTDKILSTFGISDIVKEIEKLGTPTNAVSRINLDKLNNKLCESLKKLPKNVARDIMEAIENDISDGNAYHTTSIKDVIPEIYLKRIQDTLKDRVNENSNSRGGLPTLNRHQN
ncbi:MAG: hypothetical protein Ta2D_13490 [Rickettsiales bacterium]|nr:MAG: hypothetical protein Ta2D_13490 [Rickettsiales bacterium]